MQLLPHSHNSNRKCEAQPWNCLESGFTTSPRGLWRGNGLQRNDDENWERRAWKQVITKDCKIRGCDEEFEDLSSNLLLTRRDLNSNHPQAQGIGFAMN
jgi:hypothetical protein